jgi:PKD repeat protein
MHHYWDLGDGTQVDNSLRTRHTYADDGEYSVLFRATDNDGGVTDVVLIAHIGNLPPTVEAGPDREVNEGDSITFTGLASDPGVQDALSYDNPDESSIELLVISVDVQAWRSLVDQVAH